MTSPGDLRFPELPSLDQDAATALDEAIDAILGGRVVDRAGLLTRYPQLAPALNALDQLGGEVTTLPGDNPPSSAEPIPERIGPYRLERRLGAGGFGTVYLAHDPDLKRHVALKVLHPGRLDQPEIVTRFRREAYTTARLRHPGIVQLYDYSRQGPPYFLVTEFVEGVDPRSWCRQHQATLPMIADLVARIAEAVDYAHSQGVCHRDLKPGNILIDSDGNPHILDFGLARLAAQLDETVEAPTADGHILGSLSYMAPEQAAGHSHEADNRSDVYSLGVILYELLTERLPFLGPVHTLPSQVVEDAPPRPRTVNRAVPRDLEAICLKALAKNPADRYASAAALARDLHAFQRGEAIEARPFTWLVRLHKTLGRRHRDMQAHNWMPLLLLEGVAILAGCALMNLWELTVPSGRQWGPILLTKLGQVALMLLIAVRFRPVKEPTLTPAERQIWALIPGYYGGFFTLMLLNCFLDVKIPLAPVLAVLSGVAFMTLAATIWGWNYVWGVAFFGLALVTVLFPACGSLLVGVGWFVCLGIGSVQMRVKR